VPQLQTNPWSFTNADQATSKSITSIAVDGFVALVTITAHGYTDRQWVSLTGITGTNKVPNGGYQVLAPTANNFYIQLNVPTYTNSGAVGTAYTVAYAWKVRIEQLTWQNATISTTLTINDTNGNLVWTQTAGQADGTYTYGKLYWVDGLVLVAIPNGTVIITIN
jgi:hypothetical protein